MTRKADKVCAKCGRPIEGVPLRIGADAYCADCYQVEVAKEDNRQLVVLFDDIRRIYAIPEISVRTQSAIKRLVAKGYKVSGIRGTLYYFFTILENVPDSIDKIYYVIDDNYDAARQFIEDCRRKKAAAAALPAKDPVRVITIDEPKPSEPTYKYKMEDL
jgi:hypothetical protein